MDLYTVRNNIMKGVPLQELNLRVCFYARVSTDNQLIKMSNYILYLIKYLSLMIILVKFLTGNL